MDSKAFQACYYASLFVQGSQFCAYNKTTLRQMLAKRVWCCKYQNGMSRLERANLIVSEAHLKSQHCEYRGNQLK